jgi:hypothetical protein
MRIAWVLIAACGGSPPPVVANRVAEPKQPPATEGVDVGVDMAPADRPNDSTLDIGIFTRRYDNVVAEVATKDHVVIKLAGAVREQRLHEDADGSGETIRVLERSDDAARSITIGLPAGIQLDVHAGQHLRGKIAATITQRSGHIAVELSDDAGPVFLSDPPSTHFEPGAALPNAPASEDNVERHTVTVTLPTTKTPVALDGWSRRHLGGFDYEVYGFAETVKAGARSPDWTPPLHFALVRQPK